MEAKILQGKVAVVCGGAGDIGSAIARRYATEGASVIVADHDAVRGKAVVEEIQGRGGDACFLETEMTDREQVRQMAATAVERYSRVDVLVNAVGMMFVKPFLECTEEDWWTVMDNNLLAPIHAMWEIVPYMQKRQCGSVINLSSKFGAPRPNNEESFETYANAALTMVSRCAQLDLVKEGIRVNVIAPGLTESRWTEGNARAAKFLDPMDGIPMGRFAQPEEVAAAALYLASDEAAYVSGAVLEIDGGFISGNHVTPVD